MLPISFSIALRYWRAKSADRFGRLVTNLASFGIVLGVMALIIVLSIMNGLERQQKQQVLSFLPHAILQPTQGVLKLSQNVPSMPNFIQKSVPINRTKVILQTSHGVSAGQVIGVQQFADDPLLEGFPNTEFNQLLPVGEFNLIIGSILADQLQLNVGDKVRLMITENSQYTPFGRVPVQRLFKISAVYASNNEQAGYEIFANLTDIGRLLRLPADQVQGYRLFLQDPFKITQLSQFFPQHEWTIEDWRSQKGEFFQAVRMEKNMMGLLISLIIIVAISNILTSLSLMVVDKQGEIAILQTLGLNKRQIRHIFIGQGMLVGLVGTFIGVLFGALAVVYLQDILILLGLSSVYLPTAIEPIQVGVIIGLSLLCSLLSTLYPAYRAAKVEPAVALRYE